MDFTIAQSQLEILRKRNYQLLLVSGTLLLSNLFLALLCWYTTVHQSRTIVPVTITSPFSVSDSRVDAAYLQQMSLFFLSNRLDVTPSTVDESHQLLLEYTTPAFYAAFQDILQQEDLRVKHDKISSTFFVSSIQTNPVTLTALAKGMLNRWVGERALSPAKKTYRIQYAYQNGRIHIVSFTEITGDSHA